MLERIRLMLGLTDNQQDTLISLLIQDAQEEAISFCHLKEYPKTLDSTIAKMVVQNFNRIGSEGLNSSSISGAVSETYIDGYSSDVMAALRRHRKIVSR